MKHGTEKENEKSDYARQAPIFQRISLEKGVKCTKLTCFVLFWLGKKRAGNRKHRTLSLQIVQCQIYAALWPGGWLSQLVGYLILLSVQL